MAESILFSRVDNILATIASLAGHAISLAWGFETDLKRLDTSLCMIKAVVLDAEEQQVTNHNITLWLKHFKDISYDVEDVLDDFAYQLLEKRIVKTYGGFNRKVSNFLSRSNPIASRLRIGHQIKDLRLRLDEIAAKKAQFNLVDRLDIGHVPLKEREVTHSFIHSSDIIGREVERENIVEFLVNSHRSDVDDDNVSVIPIVGIGGLGKTALAKMVFNDPRVVDHFDKKIWVCLGDMKEFNVNRVMAKIAREMGVADLNPQELQKAIRERLQGKMFLLVVDDVWEVNRDSWLELKSLLANGCEGSKIVVTTRISSVASCVCTTAPHNLQGLPHKECVSLFKKLAFASEAEVDEKLMKIGEDIVKKCNGVPLAVRGLGSLLFSKSEEDEWLSVRDNNIWKNEENKKGILPVLKFSYDHLPYHLKQCFVFCSTFFEDYEFDDQLIISFWMAHGLLESSKESKKPEDIGKQYIKELLFRGFFQDCREYALGWTFKMYDLVRDLACSLGQEEFAMISDSNKENAKNARHVSLEREEFLTNSNKGIRTLFVISSNLLTKPCVSKFKCLRFLCLAYSNFKELPITIGALKHLRYLDLSHCRRLERLPKSVCKLYNLQTLNLSVCVSLQELPEDIRELINLRNLWIITQQKHLTKSNEIESLFCSIFGD